VCAIKHEGAEVFEFQVASTVMSKRAAAKGKEAKAPKKSNPHVESIENACQSDDFSLKAVLQALQEPVRLRYKI